MKYSKGDTIELKDGRVALVLKEGINGIEFVAQYGGQMVRILSSIDSNEFILDKAHGHKDVVWYQVLVGDQKVWAADFFLYFRIYGMWKKE